MFKSARPPLLLIGVAATLFLFNLGATRLWDMDEAIFSQAAHEMLDRGDYVVPMFNGQLLPDKPALMYWLMIGAYRIFGVNEFAARCGSALAGLGSVLLTYALGCRLFSGRAGFWAGLILASNLNFMIISRAATPDALLTFFTTLAVWLFVRGTSARPGAAVSAGCSPSWSPVLPVRWSTYAQCYAAMGAAVLVKGPVGVVLPTATLGLFLLIGGAPQLIGGVPQSIDTFWGATLSGAGRLRRNWQAIATTFAPLHVLQTIWQMRPVTALATVAIVAGPWYVWVGLRTNWQWPSQFFGVHNFGRFLSAMDNHRGSILYYLVAVAVLFFPWSCLLAASLLELVRRGARAGAGRPAVFLIAAWLIVWIGFFSLASTKLPSYIIPCYPALALATALYICRWIEEPATVAQAWPTTGFAILGLAGAGILIVMPVVSEMVLERDWVLGLAGLVPLIGSLIGLAFTRRGDLTRAAATLGVTAVIFATWLLGFTIQRVDRLQHSQALAGIIAHQTEGAPAHVASFCFFRPSMVFYGSGPVATLTEPEEVAAFFSSHRENAFLYTLDDKMPKLASLLPPDVAVIESRPAFFKSARVLLLGRPAHATARTARAPSAPQGG